MTTVMDSKHLYRLFGFTVLLIFAALPACSQTAPQDSLTQDLQLSAAAFAEEQSQPVFAANETEQIILEAEPVAEAAPEIVADTQVVAQPVVIQQDAAVAQPVVVAEVVEQPVVVAEVVEVVEQPVVVAEVVEQPVVAEVVEVIDVPATPTPIEPNGVVIDPASLDPNSNAIGYYKMFNVSGDGSGRDMTLSILPNGNVKWRIDRHNGEEPVTEIGTWVSGDETITVRLAGFENSDENISAEYLFTRSGDFLYSGEFMGEKVMLYRFRALAAGVVQPMYDTSMAQARIQDTSFAGTYKAMLAASDSPGRDTTITLKEGGSLRWISYSLNREEPTIENGSWTVDGKNLTLLVTERNGRSLRTPMLYTFTLIDGVLHSEKLATNLYTLPDLFVGSANAFQVGNN